MKKRHGLSRHKLFIVWKNMIYRCYSGDPKQCKGYGSRGIKVYIRWRVSFTSFYNWSINNGWKENLQIDRINNDGNYHPDNCRFVTATQNQLNRNLQKNNTSGYKGVHLHKPLNKYQARININKKRKHIGYFDTAKEAHEAREKYLTGN